MAVPLTRTHQAGRQCDPYKHRTAASWKVHVRPHLNWSSTQTKPYGQYVRTADLLATYKGKGNECHTHTGAQGGGTHRSSSCHWHWRWIIPQRLWHMAGVTLDLRLPSQLHSTAAALWSVFISHPAEGMRLSWPEWLVTHQDDVPANSHPSQY